jgi:hypothetical protein
MYVLVVLLLLGPVDTKTGVYPEGFHSLQDCKEQMEVVKQDFGPAYNPQIVMMKCSKVNQPTL